MEQISLFFEEEQQEKTQKELSFKFILQADDNWQRYNKKYKDELREVEIEEVEKMLSCGDFKNGFATIVCLNDGEMKRVPFSCKSRLCTKCGKRHADEWAEKIN